MPAPPDIYKTDVDFTALALRYPEFAKKLKANRQLDFSDPESVRQLTKALLHRDFELRITLPEDRLCPPVPNRFNYILFVQRLLDSTQDNYNDKYDPKRKVIGLDIGTGASAIYPLLACRQRPSWLFLATEIDDKSRKFAEKNVQDNGLQSRIKLIEIDSTAKTIIPVMALEPFDRCTGRNDLPWREVSFVSQIFDESTLPQNRNKVQWFSSMLGKLGSVTTIIDKLKERGCTNYAVTEFVQGQKTRRWCVAWSWIALRPSHEVVRGTDAVEKKYLPFPTELDITVDSHHDDVSKKVDEEIAELTGIEWRWRADIHTGIGRSMDGDVWSRHARRRQKKIGEQSGEFMDVEPTEIRNDNEDEEDDDPEPKFVFKITRQSPDSKAMSGDERPSTSLKLRWLQGQDSTLFESFHGWLKRKLTA